jgi:hypothetical protein
MGATVDSKRAQRVEIKSGDRGEVSAVFATLNVIDKDRDVTLQGAFKTGQEILISAYGHASWGGALPVGKGVIRETKAEAIMDGQFFMDTDHGRNTYQTVKAIGVRQDGSYGYDILDAEDGVFDGQDVQFLKSLDVQEASPVLIGAGVNTRTLSTKAAKEQAFKTIEAARNGASEYKAAIRPHEAPVSVKAWNPREAAAALGDTPTIIELRAAHAWSDPNGDPEAKASYGFGHHEPGGPANLRACLIGIGHLNGEKGAGIPDGDRRGIYNHLAAHLEEGDIEAPPIRSGSGGMVKQNDELAVVLADLASARERTWETRITRAAKGKSLGQTSVLLLEWITDELKAYRSLLDSPSEDAAREFLRFIAAQQRPGT